MYKGSCLCGKITYEITGPIRNIVYCHCSQCRKAQGSAFATNGIVDSGHFQLITGEGLLTGYESTPGQTKYFCSHCGSPIISRTATKPDQVRVRIGTIESEITERPMAHIFVDSKADWEDISDDLPRYDNYEPVR
jgi:hypothetical protein